LAIPQTILGTICYYGALHNRLGFGGRPGQPDIGADTDDTSGQVVYIEDATHWVLRDAPEETSELLVDFFVGSD
jgi:hypothetical protein